MSMRQWGAPGGHRVHVIENDNVVAIVTKPTPISNNLSRVIKDAGQCEHKNRGHVEKC